MGASTVPKACPRACDFAGLGGTSEGSSGAEAFKLLGKSAVFAGSIPGASTIFSREIRRFGDVGTAVSKMSPKDEQGGPLPV
jgi:hypothetical protein